MFVCHFINKFLQTFHACLLQYGIIAYRYNSLVARTIFERVIFLFDPGRYITKKGELQFLSFLKKTRQKLHLYVKLLPFRSTFYWCVDLFNFLCGLWSWTRLSTIFQ